MLLGVADPMAERMLSWCCRPRCRTCVLVHGHDGLDELTTTGPSTVSSCATARSPVRRRPGRDRAGATSTPRPCAAVIADTNAMLARRARRRAGAASRHRRAQRRRRAVGRRSRGDLDGGHGPGGRRLDDGEALRRPRAAPGRSTASVAVCRGDLPGCRRDRAGARVVGQPRSRLRHPRSGPRAPPGAGFDDPLRRQRPGPGVERPARRITGGRAPRRPCVPPARRDGPVWIRSRIPMGRGLGFSGSALARARGGPRAGATVGPSPRSTRPSSSSTSPRPSRGTPTTSRPPIFGGVVARRAASGEGPPALRPAVVVWVPASTTSTDQSAPRSAPRSPSSARCSTSVARRCSSPRSRPATSSAAHGHRGSAAPGSAVRIPPLVPPGARGGAGGRRVVWLAVGIRTDHRHDVRPDTRRTWPARSRDGPHQGAGHRPRRRGRSSAELSSKPPALRGPGMAGGERRDGRPCRRELVARLQRPDAPRRPTRRRPTSRAPSGHVLPAPHWVGWCPPGARGPGASTSGSVDARAGEDPSISSATPARQSQQLGRRGLRPRPALAAQGAGEAPARSRTSAASS